MKRTQSESCFRSRLFFFFCSGSFRQSSAQHCGHGNLTKVQARSAFPAEKQQKEGEKTPNPQPPDEKGSKRHAGGSKEEHAAKRQPDS